MSKEVSKKKVMTTREVAEALGVSIETIRINGKALFPSKKVENGKPTLWTEEECKMILEKIRNNQQGSMATSKATLEHIISDLTPALMIKQAMELAQKGYELELERIKAEGEKLKAEKERLQIELDTSKEWYSIKRMEKLNPSKKFAFSILKAQSIRMGVGIKKVFDANYGEVNAYHKSVWEALYFDTLNYEEMGE